MTTTSAAAQSGYTWPGVRAVVVGWMFGGAGCHVTSKGTELSYNLSFFYYGSISLSGLSCFPSYYPHFVDLHIPWILSAFFGYIHILWVLSTYCGYCVYIRISWILFVFVTLRAT